MAHSSTRGSEKVEKLLLRPGEAAEMLGVGRSKVYALLAAGELPGVRVGHSVRVPLEELRKWVDEHSRGAGGEGSAGRAPLTGEGPLGQGSDES